MPSLQLCVLPLGLCIFPHLFTTQHTSPLSPHPQLVNTHLGHSPTPPHTYPILYPTSSLHVGAIPGRMGDASSPRVRQHPPNSFNAQVAYKYSKLGISERDDLFLVFTSFWAKNWASAVVSILLNHPPNAQHKFAPSPLHPQHLFPPCTPVSFD